MATNPKPNDPLTSRPPPDQMKSKYRLHRVPGKGFPPLIILSHDTVGANTHFAGGRTRPCPGDQCAICEGGQLPRWRGYLAFTTPRLDTIGFVELTPAVMDTVDKFFRRNRTLRGARVTLTRKNSEANGELWCKIEPPAAAQAELPKAPSTRKFLTALWQLQETEVKTRSRKPPTVYRGDDGPDFGDSEVA